MLVPIIGFFYIGGPAETFSTIRAIDPTLLDLFKGTTVVGIISALAWGLGYFGQPHIIVRFMAIKTIEETKSARRIGMGWMIFLFIRNDDDRFSRNCFFRKIPQYSVEIIQKRYF